MNRDYMIGHVAAVLLVWAIGESLGVAGLDFDRRLFVLFLLLGWITKCLWHIGAWMMREDASEP